MSFFPDSDELDDMRRLAAEHLVHGTTCKVLPASVGGTDIEGRTTLTWADPATVTPIQARVWPSDATELVDGMWVQTGGWKARVPADTTVGHGDRLTADGRLFDIRTVTPHVTHVGVVCLNLTLSEVPG